MGSIRQEVYDNTRLTQKDLDIANVFCNTRVKRPAIRSASTAAATLRQHIPLHMNTSLISNRICILLL